VKNGTDKVRKNKNAQKGMKKNRTYVPPKFANSQQQEKKKKGNHHGDETAPGRKRRAVGAGENCCPAEAFEDVVWEVQHGEKKTMEDGVVFKTMVRDSMNVGCVVRDSMNVGCVMSSGLALGGHLVITKQTFQIPLMQNINAKLARAAVTHGAVAQDGADVVLRDSGRRVT
jgi:hypothetical protein